jgi:predicted S18 family serine protease
MQAGEDADRVTLLTHTADSVKRFGNYLQERHIAALLDLVRQSEGELAEAAARLHGALNLPTTDAVEMIGL